MDDFSARISLFQIQRGHYYFLPEQWIILCRKRIPHCSHESHCQESQRKGSQPFNKKNRFLILGCVGGWCKKPLKKLNIRWQNQLGGYNGMLVRSYPAAWKENLEFLQDILPCAFLLRKRDTYHYLRVEVTLHLSWRQCCRREATRPVGGVKEELLLP